MQYVCEHLSKRTSESHAGTSHIRMVANSPQILRHQTWPNYEPLSFVLQKKLRNASGDRQSKAHLSAFFKSGCSPTESSEGDGKAEMVVVRKQGTFPTPTATRHLHTIGDRVVGHPQVVGRVQIYHERAEADGCLACRDQVRP